MTSPISQQCAKRSHFLLPIPENHTDEVGQSCVSLWFFTNNVYLISKYIYTIHVCGTSHFPTPLDRKAACTTSQPARWHAHRCAGWPGLWLACIWACLPPAADESLTPCSSARGWAGRPLRFLPGAWQFFLFCAGHQKQAP